MSTPGFQPPSPPHVTADSSSHQLFAGPPPEHSNRGRLIVAAAAIVLIVLVGAFVLRGSQTERHLSTNTVLSPDPYASNLPYTQLNMSQSTSLSGGTSTFIDGRVKNIGSDTVTGITMQVLFRNDVRLPPQVETLPLTLIRTHQPYVDIEPVSAAPLKPGEEAEFRLIFETVTGSWNQQMPDLITVKVAKH